MKIVGISGSLRIDSLNTKLLIAASNLLGNDIEFELVDWAQLPVFNQDKEYPTPASVERFRQAVEKAAAVIVATPEYNGSVPGGLKNALDWASRSEAGLTGSALYSKPVTVLSASEGQFGAVWAADDLIKILKTQGARVMKSKFSLPLADKALATGLSQRQAEQLQVIIDQLVTQTRAIQKALARA